MNFLKNKYVIGALIIVILAIIVGSIFAFTNGKYETYEVSRGNFIKTVLVSGELIGSQDVDLSFKRSGIIQAVYFDIGDSVKAGDVIAVLDQRTLANEINEARADLLAEQSRLKEISGESNSISGNEVKAAKETLINTIKKSYVQADDIVKNSVDTFFEDPLSRTPEFLAVLSNYILRQEINSKRVQVGDVLLEWKDEMDDLTVQNLDNENIENAIDNLGKVEDLLATISKGVDDMRPAASKTQVQIDNYISGISSARNSIASTRVDISMESDELRSIQASVPIQEAKVQSFEANLGRLASEQSDYVIVAPFDGVITKNNAEIGKVVSIGEAMFSFISDSEVEIETFIPEIKVADVKVNDRAVVVMDAFGDDKKFEAVVSHIDPTDTKKDGLTTYRALIDFINFDDRMRPGMTADAEIYVLEIDDVIVIPAHLIKNDSDGDYVNILDDKGEVSRRNIKVGDSDGKGGKLVESGVSEGDKIVKSE